MVEISDRSKLAQSAVGRLGVVPDGHHEPVEATQAGPASHDHVVQFYEDEDGLADAVTVFLAAGLRAGDLVVVIATAPHRSAFQRRLESDGFEVEQLVQAGRLSFLDAHEALSNIMQAGEPDPALFQAEIGGFISRLLVPGGTRRLRAYGEMVDVLWRDGQRAAALRLEELWNELQEQHPFTLFCAYSMASFYKEPAAVQQVCAAHTHVVADRAAEHRNSDLCSTAPAKYAHLLAREVAHRSEVELALRQSLRELRRREDQLRQSEQQFRDFVENVALGLHQVDPEGKILWANRAEYELLGYTRDEYIGRSIFDVHADRAVVEDLLERLNRGEEIHDHEARLRAKDGSIRHVLISSNVQARGGELITARCVTRDITERKQAEEARRAHDAQLQIIVDALPVLVAYVNVDGRYELVSAGYERWFGRSKAELRGSRAADVLGTTAYDIVRPYFERAVAGEAVTYETEILYPTGTKFIHASYIPQRDADGRVSGVVSLVADVTDQRNFETYRAAAAERAQRLLKITSALADAVTTSEVFEAVVDRVAVAINASSAALWLVDDDGRMVRLVRAVGYSESAAKALEALPLDTHPSIPALDSIRRAEPIWIASQAALLRDYPHLAPVATSGRSFQASCLPLSSEGRTLGALSVTTDDTRQTMEEERSFLLLVARYAGQAIERLRLLEAERQSRAEADAAAARLGVLGHAARVFVDANLDLAGRLDEITRELGRVLNSSVGITLIEGDGRPRTTTLYDPLPQTQQLLRSLVESLPVPDPDPDDSAASATREFRAFAEQHPTYAMMCAPLRVRERRIGTVTLLRTHPGETYTHADLELLEMLAERAASAIDNARLYRDNLEARSRAEQLYRFAHAAASADKVEEVFEVGLDAIAGALGTDRAAVLLFDDDGVMRFRAWRGLSEDYRRAVEGHSPWARDAVAPQPVLVEDVATDASLKGYLPLFRSEGIGSLGFIPIVTGGTLLGKFMIYYAEPHSYSQTEIELASAIGNHLASVTSRFSAMAELERTLHYSELFAGVLAHDLRNPLGAILTAAQLVLMRQVGEGDPNAKPLSRIVASGQRMERMIDQLLDFTRARVGGGIEIQARDTNLADLCSQAISELELVFTDRSIVCSVLGDQGGRWDPDRLLQIISNLVANASQHGSPSGEVVVRLDGRQAGSVVLEVHNPGTIAEALLPALFDPFRGTRHRRDHSRGLGLGLFIVKELVRAHGGTVDVRSSEPHGTTFTVRLPRRHLAG